MNGRIKTVRTTARNKPMTQEKFAAEINLTRNFIAQIECGNRIPSDRTIRDICEKFNVSEKWLRTGEGEMLAPAADNADTEVRRFAAELLKGDVSPQMLALIRVLERTTLDEWQLFQRKLDELVEELKNAE